MLEQADMSERLDAEDLDVTPDDVLVLKNSGPVGAPGMPEPRHHITTHHITSHHITFHHVTSHIT